MAGISQTKNTVRNNSQAVPAKITTTGPGSNSLTPLNFKVQTVFHREFKTYAAQRGITMLELLQEGFRLVKERRG
jgi:hypothetical protein